MTDSNNSASRLGDQIAFILEIDKIKQIIRKTRLFDGSRLENDAEHSWHLAMMAVVLREHARQAVNLERVVIMLLIHDLVEIDAGDTFLYAAEREQVHERELLAAERIFGLLPVNQAQEFKTLWEEFEAQQSPDAQFAAALDRLEPVMQNWQNGGLGWKEHGISQEQVLAKNAHIAAGSPELHAFALKIIKEGFAYSKE